jgi:hypothetical protein
MSNIGQSNIKETSRHQIVFVCVCVHVRECVCADRKFWELHKTKLLVSEILEVGYGWLLRGLRTTLEETDSLEEANSPSEP